MRKVFLFSGVLISHFTLQFASWSYSDSPWLRNSATRIVFYILATPILLLGGLFTNVHFWILATTNSVVWAMIISFIAARYFMKQ
jgi:hypothetical protein